MVVRYLRRVSLSKDVAAPARRMAFVRGLLLLIGVSVGSLEAFGGQTTFSPSAIETLQLRSNMYLIAGAGENIGVQIGDDGLVLVNAGSQPQSPQILAAISAISDRPIRFIVDTSADADAVGGNAALAQAGRSIYFMGTEPVGGGKTLATTLATSNLLLRLSSVPKEGREVPDVDWPSYALTAPPYYIYFNHEPIRLYPEKAKDDSDTLVLFQASDVIFSGNVIDAEHFPTIDVQHGGGIEGEITALNHILQLSDTSVPFAWRNEGTLIVPSYGRVFLQADVVRYRDMLIEIRDVIKDMMSRHMTLDEIQSASPCLAYENEYGRDSGPWTTHDFVQALFQSLSRKP